MRDLERNELDFVSGGVPTGITLTNGTPGSSAGKGPALNRGIGGLGGWGFQRGASGASSDGTIGFNGGTGTTAGGQASYS
jgi:hypothetical protein